MGGGGEGSQSRLFISQNPTVSREHTFNYRCDKEDMREFKCNESVIPQPQVEIAVSPHSMLYRLARGRKLQNISQPQWNSVQELANSQDQLPAV